MPTHSGVENSDRLKWSRDENAEVRLGLFGGKASNNKFWLLVSWLAIGIELAYVCTSVHA
jgi:hypothetical protein